MSDVDAYTEEQLILMCMLCVDILYICLYDCTPNIPFD